mmetsp:Transcript_30844/g.67473  ORF Transcript_30844/g.67473 Transcript_30844/m.67473 type:complete len:253 (+) Transcript_30844:444-1202(+)
MLRSHSERSSYAACKYSSRLAQTWPSLALTRLMTPSSAHRGPDKAASAAAATSDQCRTAAERAAARRCAGMDLLSSECATTASRLSVLSVPTSARSASSFASHRFRVAVQSNSSAKCRASKMCSTSTSSLPYRIRSKESNASWLRPSGMVNVSPAPGHRMAPEKKKPSFVPATMKRCAGTFKPLVVSRLQSANCSPATASRSGLHLLGSKGPKKTSIEAFSSSGSASRTEANAALAPAGSESAEAALPSTSR